MSQSDRSKQYSIIDIPLMLMAELTPEFCVDSVGQKMCFRGVDNECTLYQLKPDVEGLKFAGVLCVDTVKTSFPLKSPVMHSLYLLPRMPQADEEVQAIGGVIRSINAWDSPIITLSAGASTFGSGIGMVAQEQLKLEIDDSALWFLPRKLGGIIMERAAELVQDPACIVQKFPPVEGYQAA